MKTLDRPTIFLINLLYHKKRPHESDSENEKNMPNDVSSTKKYNKNKNKSIKFSNEVNVEKIIKDQKNLEQIVNNLQKFFTIQFKKITKVVLESSSKSKTASQ
jgi:hypothetical protein